MRPETEPFESGPNRVLDQRRHVDEHLIDDMPMFVAELLVRVDDDSLDRSRSHRSTGETRTRTMLNRTKTMEKMSSIDDDVKCDAAIETLTEEEEQGTHDRRGIADRLIIEITQNGTKQRHERSANGGKCWCALTEREIAELECKLTGSSHRRFESAYLCVGNHDRHEHHEKPEQITEASLNGRFDTHEIGSEIAVLQYANDADRGEKKAQRVQLSLNGEQSRRQMIEGSERDGHGLVDVPMPMDVHHDDHERDHQQTHVDPIPEVKKETPAHARDFRRFDAHE